jgi:Ca-activated chloride channel homolog
MASHGRNERFSANWRRRSAAPSLRSIRWMSVFRLPRRVLATALVVCAVAALTAAGTGPRDTGRLPQNTQTPRFRSDLEMLNVTVTVTDAQGRFVPNLRQEDFVVYEDGKVQTIAYFASERVPVSLGLAIDTSGSMAGVKMDAAREALRRFVVDLLGAEDEWFLYRFNEEAELVQGWTRDRAAIVERMARIRPNGGTALYDTVAETVAVAQAGQYRKRALVVISDGNDTNSLTKVDEVQRRIRQSEVLVYAVGIDGNEGPQVVGVSQRPRPRPPVGIPIPQGPFPGGGGRYPQQPPVRPVPPVPWPGGTLAGPRDDRVNELALRAMTDDSGGRTEIVRTASDLGPATAAIANELSQQYFLAYPVGGTKEGRWRSIRVEVRNPNLRVRARRGYLY